MQDRAAELRPALQPYARPHEDDRVALALSGMFDGFPSMRQRGVDALGRIDGAMRMVADFPAWAIEEACLSIQRNGYEIVEDGVGRTERHWPPGDPEIHKTVAEVVRMHGKALTNAEGLLTAPIKAPEPYRAPAPLPKLQPLPVRRYAPSGHLAPIADGKHAQRVQADLEARRADIEARRARREAGQAEPRQEDAA